MLNKNNPYYKGSALMKNDRKTLTELTNYYITRYGIESHVNDDNESLRRTLRQKIERLLKSISVGNTSLYHAINENGQARNISIAEFEKYCFAKWAEFLVGDTPHALMYVERTNENLIADLKKHKIDLDWEETASKEDALRDKFIEEDDPGSYMYDDYDPTVVTDNELAQKGHEMMLEAIFAALVGEFDWNRLKQDMRLAKQYDSNYGSDNDGKIYRAKACLNDYRNYCDPKPDSFTAAEPETAATDE